MACGGQLALSEDSVKGMNLTRGAIVVEMRRHRAQFHRTMERRVMLRELNARDKGEPH